jgi:hypothetical protein
MSSDPLIVIARLADIFDQLGIPYAVGGSLASSVYGVPRSTNDAALIADIRLTHVKPLQETLESDFYVAGELILDAIRRRSSFNVIHLVTMFKADIFLPRPETLGNEELNRVRPETIQMESGSRVIRFASPEDTILQKLLWFRLGGETSERQWRDVRGVLSIQGTSLDHDYLIRSAQILKVTDLLERAREESAK